MGKLIWNQWARLIALTAGTFEVIGGIFGIFYRYSMFNAVIKDIDFLFNPINVVAILCIIFGTIVLAIELPLKFLNNTIITTSYIPRILLYFIISAISVFNYQNVNPALYLFIAMLMYIKAAVNGETNRVNSNIRSRA
ncbi:19788_t:CDS:2 [Funneliformis geosporum]|uniref:8791_t:CDS:1 n=1 Tax=Funneliformis geosporum TaxID=1117311 RepID=A0A9W4SH62_9GLOM|nr:19788_t:CDS:2 [Funneliformis geosporum]CAI2168927.1 8791_t:CDS:2 [Funneliformis geosporum]